MRFIKELITRKQQAPVQDEGMDLSEFAEIDNFDFAEDDKLDKIPEGDINESLASIQSKLQSALNKVDVKGDAAEGKNEASGQVMNFTDLVEDRKKAKPTLKNMEQATKVSVPDMPADVKPPELSVNERAKEAIRKIEATQVRVQKEALAVPDQNDASASAPASAETGDHVAATVQGSPKVNVKNIEVHKTSQAAPETQVSAPEENVTKTVDSRENSAGTINKPAEPEPADLPRVVEVPAPAPGRAGRRAGRVKTRMLGFESVQDTEEDPFDKTQENNSSPQIKFPVGWIVVVSGPGRGSSFSLFNGASQIGRGEDQAIKLDFGDNSVSRSNHAAIAYDDEQRAFFLGHGGKANLVRLNNKPVLSTEEISDGDLIRIGETTLRFVALCSDEFDWNVENQKEIDNAAIA